MCLYTKQICPQRAKKDIVCYKVFTDSFDELHMMTPYMRKHILRPTKNNPTLMDDTDIHVDKTNFTEPVIHGNGVHKIKKIGYGMIHAYARQRDVITCYGPAFLYKCIIPKGTLYYKGILGYICAKKMLIVEQINQ